VAGSGPNMAMAMVDAEWWYKSVGLLAQRNQKYVTFLHISWHTRGSCIWQNKSQWYI